MNQAPTLGKIRKDEESITLTLILPPRRGRRFRKEKEKTGLMNQAPTTERNKR